MTDLRVRTPIDLSWIDLHPGATAFEWGLIQCARGGENPFALETMDEVVVSTFGQDGAIATPEAQASMARYFGSVRQQLFRTRVRPQIEAVIEKQRMGTVTMERIDRIMRDCGGQITNLKEMGDIIQNVLALDQKRWDTGQKLHLIYSAVILMNARDINRDQLRNGRPPLLEGFEEAAVTMLRYIEKGALKFIFETSTDYLGQYDPVRNALRIDNVSHWAQMNPVRSGTSVASTVLHELWHFYQDITCNPDSPELSLYRAERPTHLLTCRYDALTRSEKELRQAIEEERKMFREASAKGVKGNIIKLLNDAMLLGKNDDEIGLECAMAYLGQTDDVMDKCDAYDQALRFVLNTTDIVLLWDKLNVVIENEVQMALPTLEGLSGKGGQRVSIYGKEMNRKLLRHVPKRPEGMSREDFHAELGVSALHFMTFLRAYLYAEGEVTDDLLEDVKFAFQNHNFCETRHHVLDGVPEPI